MPINMQEYLNKFGTPEFQKAWAYGDRSAASLGLNPEEYDYFQKSGFQPYQPNATTNIQNFGGVWKDTFGASGQPIDFNKAPALTNQPVAAPTNPAYTSSIQSTLPGGSSSIVRPTGLAAAGNNTIGSDTFFRPPGTTTPAPATGRGGTLAQIRGGVTTPTDNGGIFGTGRYSPNPDILANPVPPLPGDPVGQPGYTPPAASGGDPRAARAAAEAARTAQGTASSLNRAGALQAIIKKGLDMVGGAVGGSPSVPNGPPPTTGGGGTAGLGGIPPAATNRNYFPDDPQSQFDDGLGLPRTSITPEDVMLDPGFKWQKEQLDRMREDRFAAKGRVGSTDYFNAGRADDADLLSREYNRINTQQWDRSMEMNRLLYDRRYQENVLNYEREFRENERKYGREKAEEILAYERLFREDARDYDRVRYRVDLGFAATVAGAAA